MLTYIVLDLSEYFQFFVEIVRLNMLRKTIKAVYCADIGALIKRILLLLQFIDIEG